MTTKIRRDESGLDSVDPAQLRDARGFREIVRAKAAVADAEEELREAVLAARAAGDSWTVVGAALGTSKQAAYQRFAKAVDG